MYLSAEGSMASIDVESRAKKPQRTALERWEESLMLSTSLSQLWVHCSVLETSVVWSRSSLHAYCRICRRKTDGEHMLLCDACDRGHHMYCLKPPVKVSTSYAADLYLFWEMGRESIMLPVLFYLGNLIVVEEWSWCFFASLVH